MRLEDFTLLVRLFCFALPLVIAMSLPTTNEYVFDLNYVWARNVYAFIMGFAWHE